LRPTLPVSGFDELIHWLRTSHPKAAHILHPRYPRDLAHLKDSYVFRPDTPEREIRWAGAWISSEAQKIEAFLSNRRAFQDGLLRDNFIGCTQALNSIEQSCGHSLWLITTRIALLSLSDGLDAQKQFSSSVKAQAPHEGITSFIAHYASIRNEQTVTPGTFSQLFTSHVQRLELSPGLAPYLLHHILPEFPVSREGIRDIVRHESAGPVIDCYESLIRTMRVSVASGYSDLLPSFASALAFMREHDPRVSFLLAEALQEQPPLQVDERAIQAFEELVSGAYQHAIASSADTLSTSPASFDAIEISARAMAILETPAPDSGSLLQRLTSRMSLILRRIDDPGSHITELTKLALNFNRHDWADALHGFIKRETAVNPFTDSPSHWYCVAALPSLSPIRQFRAPPQTC
jgi:hypothetical protein